MHPSHLLLYDSDCGFCRWGVGWVLRWDRGHLLKPVAIQEPGAATLLPGMREGERLASWHLVSADGTVRSGGAAVAPLVRLMPGGKASSALLGALPGLVERGYAWTAQNRSRLGRRLGGSSLARADALIADRARLPSPQRGTGQREEAIR